MPRRRILSRAWSVIHTRKGRADASRALRVVTRKPAVRGRNILIRTAVRTRMRERPLREKKPRKRIEDDAVLREATMRAFPVPSAAKEFQEGYRECIAMFALHAPNRHGVARLLDEHCITLEDACLRTGMVRDDVARYEGFRQAVKDLRKAKRIR